MLRNIHHHNLNMYFKYILYMDKYINYIYFHHNNILPYMIYNLMHLIYMMNMDLNMIYKLTHPNNIQMHNLYKMYLNPYNQNKDMYRMDIFMMINMFLLHIQYMQLMYLNTINKNQSIKHIIYLKNLQSIHLCMFHIPKHYYMSNMKLDMFYILNWVNRNRNHSNMICNLKHYHKCCMD